MQQETPMKTIPIISLWQPWASLVACGEKRIETRSWKWPGDLPAMLAIHAAKKWDGKLATLCCREEPFVTVLAKHKLAENTPGYWKNRMPFGAVVAVVRVVECISTTIVSLDTVGAGIRSLAGTYLRHCLNERAFGDYSPGRYAWTFDRLLRLPEPVPMRGHQSIWQWEAPADVLRWCEEQMAVTSV
jgi:hypothetical protein